LVSRHLHNPSHHSKMFHSSNSLSLIQFISPNDQPVFGCVFV